MKREDGKPMSLMIAIPMRAAVFPDCVASFLEVVAGTLDLWRHHHGNDAPFIVKTVMRAHVIGARNEIAKDALEYDTDLVLWLDDDAICGPDIFCRLYHTMIESGADAVVPWFQTRARTNVNNRLMEGKAAKADPLPPRIHDIHTTGFHCVLMKTWVIREVMRVLGSEEVFSTPTARCGEDVYFWQHATIHAGLKLVCDSRITVGHAGVSAVWPEKEEVKS